MSHALSEQVVSRARGLMPFPGAVLLALMLLSPAVSVAKAPPASKHSKSKPAEVTVRDDAAAFRVLHKHDAVINHPEKATEAQLVQAAHDLASAAELMPVLELQSWFHARLGTILYARAKAKRGPERRYFLEKANVQFHLAALTHDIDIGGTGASHVRDYEAAGEATASFILYHVGLTEYELGRPSSAVFPLDLLLGADADHGLRRPEYVEKARALLPKVKQAVEKQKEEDKEKSRRQPPPGGSPTPRPTH